MTKLNGINSIGSVVNFRNMLSVITDSHSSDWNNETFHFYTVTPIEEDKDNTEYEGIVERELEVVTAKAPLKKYVTKLASLEKKITKINNHASKEMAKISKKNGWDKMPYDHYDNDYEWMIDGMSASMGLDELHDERYAVMQLMIQTARKVNSKVA